MREGFESMEARRRALEKAHALHESGVSRVDYLYAWYSDETQIVTAKAYDDAGAALPDRGDFDDWLPSVARNVQVWSGDVMGSYSPRHHQVAVVGGYGWTPDDPQSTDGRPVPVASPDYPDLVAMLTWHPDLPDYVVERGACDPRSAVRAAVAGNPTTPAHIQASLARDDSHQVRVALARNQALSEDLLSVLAQDAHEEVRDAITWNHGAPPAVLAQLVPTTWLEVGTAASRSTVVGNALQHPNFPIDLLRRWWSEAGAQLPPAIATGLAGHPEVTADLLEELSRHEAREVRRAIAENEDALIPLAVLWRLMSDVDYVVSDPAARALQRRDFTSRDELPELESMLRLMPPKSGVRYGLVQNRSIPADLTRTIAADDEHLVSMAEWKARSARPRSAQAPLAEATQQEIASWAAAVDWSERVKAALHPEAPESLLVDMLAIDGLFDGDSDDWTKDWLRLNFRRDLCANQNLPTQRLLASAYPLARREAARQLRTTPEQLAILANDESALVRAAVARNTNTPARALDWLADDVDRLVRNGARENIAAPWYRLVRPIRPSAPERWTPAEPPSPARTAQAPPAAVSSPDGTAQSSSVAKVSQFRFGMFGLIVLVLILIFKVSFALLAVLGGLARTLP